MSMEHDMLQLWSVLNKKSSRHINVYNIACLSENQHIPNSFTLIWPDSAWSHNRHHWRLTMLTNIYTIEMVIVRIDLNNGDKMTTSNKMWRQSINEAICNTTLYMFVPPSCLVFYNFNLGMFYLIFKLKQNSLTSIILPLHGKLLSYISKIIYICLKNDQKQISKFCFFWWYHHQFVLNLLLTPCNLSIMFHP